MLTEQIGSDITAQGRRECYTSNVANTQKWYDWHCSHSMRQSLRNGTVSVPPSVCPSVCPIYRPLQQRAAGLLLWVPRTGDIDRLLHGASAAGAAAFRSLSADARGEAWRSAANASSVGLSVNAGSWTQTCYHSNVRCITTTSDHVTSSSASRWLYPHTAYNDRRRRSTEASDTRANIFDRQLPSASDVNVGPCIAYVTKCISSNL